MQANDHPQLEPVVKTPSQPQPSPLIASTLTKKRKSASAGININPPTSSKQVSLIILSLLSFLSSNVLRLTYFYPTVKCWIKMIDLDNVDEDASPKWVPLTFKRTTRFIIVAKKSSIHAFPSIQVQISNLSLFLTFLLSNYSLELLQKLVVASSQIHKRPKSGSINTSFPISIWIAIVFLYLLTMILWLIYASLWRNHFYLRVFQCTIWIFCTASYFLNFSGFGWINY